MSAPLTGLVSVTGVAQQLGNIGEHTAFTIKAPQSNGAAVYIGASTVSTATGFQLDPGDTFDYERSEQLGRPRLQLALRDFYVVGTTGDRVTWLASP